MGGRPKFTAPKILLALTPAQREALDEFAAARDMTPTEAVRLMVARHLEVPDDAD